MPIIGRGTVVQRVPHVRFTGILAPTAAAPDVGLAYRASSVMRPTSQTRRPTSGRVEIASAPPTTTVRTPLRGVTVRSARRLTPGRAEMAGLAPATMLAAQW